MPRIPVEPMSYKSLVRESELLTKLRLVRLSRSPGVTATKVATIFHCHRNTVANICTQFSKLPSNTQNILLLQKLSLEQIEKLMTPLTHTSTRPHHHPRESDQLSIYSIVWLFNEMEWRVGYRSMHAKIKRSFSDYNFIDSHLYSLTKLTCRQIRTIYQNFDLKSHKVRTYMTMQPYLSLSGCT